MAEKKQQRLTAISVFSGAMGLDLGFEDAGFETRVALDIDKNAVDTIKKNKPDLPTISDDIFDVPTEKILAMAGLIPEEATVVIGGPPCQPFSTAGRRESVSSKKGQLVFQHIRVIREAQPKFFVFENVSGIISAACKHVSYYERIENTKKLSKKEEYGSALERIVEEFSKIRSCEGGYYGINYGIVNSADFGVPQKRKRFIMIGSRDGRKIPLPSGDYGDPKSLEVKSGKKKPWLTFRQAVEELNETNPEYLPFPSWGMYMKYIPEGGCWRDLPKEILKEAMKGAYSEDKEKDSKKGGRTGFFRRLAWDKPAPTLVTSPNFKGSVLGHPTEDRSLSVREYPRIQRFPDSWQFVDGIAHKYRLIGQAVPVTLGQAIAKQILKALKNPKWGLEKQQTLAMSA